jgi:hypothetical protein
VSGRAYLSLPEVVDRYSGALSKWTIYERVRLGEMPHRKVCGKLLFIPDELSAWEDGARLEGFDSPAGRVCLPVTNGSRR